jgi:hypothetical protein
MEKYGSEDFWRSMTYPAKNWRLLSGIKGLDWLKALMI